MNIRDVAEAVHFYKLQQRFEEIVDEMERHASPRQELQSIHT